jgi:hypothetical protein
MKKVDLTQPGVFENAHEGRGFTLEPTGLRREWFGIQVPTFRFWVNEEHPFQYRLRDGTLVRFANGFPTDRGTVRPIPAQLWIAKDRFSGFYPHDAVYSTGGVWILRKGATEWEWQKVGFWEANAMLRALCRQDPIPCGWWKAGVVYAGVTLGGWAGWRGNEPRGWMPDPPVGDKPDVDDGVPIRL